ncbi:ADP-ribosylglycohydrolase family protein [Lipingzhangella sp. LS1_29]|uniref:ADP-ribosylglycohydrolase family protein n=1 Tax=Lipingzhangella rawalii TaxID=2055835 RepID=A0ABU2HB83_9ACTN|nr:ADP-ribosylglycohydrolase family protein [Lipingzhangella rawalii]MDS1272523.1 ADP-ribosylglycohydrolase family protein [Lipingzhangella rawalii]
MDPANRPLAPDYRSRVRGCLLGGAIGDILGAPVEGLPLETIHREYGRAGVRAFHGNSVTGWSRAGRITDDTQMNLFTVAGLVTAGIQRDSVSPHVDFDPVRELHRAYLAWYDTQTCEQPPEHPANWLHAQPWLYDPRGPGRTCMRALATTAQDRRLAVPAANASKGCGGVMRSAPIGLLPPDRVRQQWVFDWAATASGLTHGHPTGQLAAGAFAVLIHRVVAGDRLPQALDAVLAELARHEDHTETTRALSAARRAAEQDPVTADTVESLGQGWTGEEALSIAVYAVLVHGEPSPDSTRSALTTSVTHSGDSDSTGAVCGNLLGALHGLDCLPPELAQNVERSEVILDAAEDLARAFSADHAADSADLRRRYLATTR